MSKFLTIPQWYDLTGATCTGYSANVGNANTPVYVKDGQVVAADGGLNGFTFYADSSANELTDSQYQSFLNIYYSIFAIPHSSSNYTVANMISDILNLYEGAQGDWFLYLGGDPTVEPNGGPIFFHISLIDRRPSITSSEEKVISRVYDIEYIELNGERAHMQFHLAPRKGTLQDKQYDFLGANGTAIMTYTYSNVTYYRYSITYIGTPVTYNDTTTRVESIVKHHDIDLT